ncbi:MAG: hypothetical protein WCQ44_00090 [Opitutaceae bacterium]
MKSIFALGAFALFTTIHLTPIQAAATNTTVIAATAGNLAGKVVETMDAATYTYALIDTGTARAWVAAPQFIVKVGDTLAVADAMPMNQYRSKTLNRTFEVVYFSGNVRVNGKPAIATAAAANTATASAGKAANLTNIPRAPNGQTVAEILEGKNKFAGQPIAVRARVVKYNAQILGKNWVHLRDGSGAEGTNDLTVTTNVEVKVGDLVLVTGKLATNRDFGSGYTYAAIVEDAVVIVQ